MIKNRILSSIIVYFGILSIMSLLGIFVEFNPHSKAVINLLLFPILLSVVLFLSKEELKFSPFSKKKSSFSKSILVVIVGFIMLIIGTNFITQLKEILGVSLSNSNTNNLIKALPIVATVSVVIAPILEEVVFRRHIQSFFYKKTNAMISIILTSIVFATWHFTLIGFPNLFLSSLIFSTCYYVTNRLSVPIIIHILLNSIAALGSFFA
ncbi:CPBP family intramembrane glutamic endopeptidase [Metabacillus litoralis]|uniref:CPBP family intramembrane glutamic endopeptidase n=1 Tax=Metabacillus litoralis TaxID=152268 RepID=UPI001CFCA33B|nr:type II CAAX endopeptidase family protein [Metabacillus litoralis]